MRSFFAFFDIMDEYSNMNSCFYGEVHTLILTGRTILAVRDIG